METTQWAIIGKGFAGWHAEDTTGKVSSSGGQLEDRYASEAIDGALVYDASNVEYSTYSAFVIRGPMVNPGLPAGMIRKMLDTPRKFEPAVDRIGNGIALADVALDVYESFLRQVPGIKFGRIHKGRVLWECSICGRPECIGCARTDIGQ